MAEAAAAADGHSGSNGTYTTVRRTDSTCQLALRLMQGLWLADRHPMPDCASPILPCNQQGHMPHAYALQCSAYQHTQHHSLQQHIAVSAP
jgi:hypothetical protein